MKQEYRGFRDLIVYQLAYRMALEIFDITKSFPREEKYSLVDHETTYYLLLTSY